MTDKNKKAALTISGAALALAMGIQTFVFGKNDLETLKEEVAALTVRLEAVEGNCGG